MASQRACDARRRSSAAALGLARVLCALGLSSLRLGSAVEPTRPSDPIDSFSPSQANQQVDVDYQRQLATLELDESERSDLIVNWLNAIGRQALDGPVEAAAPHWQQAADVHAEQRVRLRDPLGVIQVDTTYERLRLARSRAALELQSFESPTDEQTLLATLRAVASSCEDLQTQLSTALRSREVRDQPEQLQRGVDLQQRLAFHLGEVRLLQAQVYPAHSPDRIALLTEATRQFASLARRVPSSPLTITARLREIECDRRLGQFDTAQLRIKQFPIAEATPSLRLLLACESAELDLSAAQPQAASEQLERSLSEWASQAELGARATARLVLVRTYLAQARRRSVTADGEQPSARQSPDDESRSAEARAHEHLQRLERENSPAWVRRAEAILTASFRAGEVPQDPQLLERTAASLYRQQAFAESVSIYHRAADLARASNRPQRAFDLMFQAAAIFHQMKQHAAASAAFQQLALDNPDHPRAAQAHWLAIVNFAQVVRATPARVTEYETLLTDHLKRWPTADSAAAVHNWYGKLSWQLGHTTRALDEWTAIDPHDPKFNEVLRSLRTAYLRYFEQETHPDTVRAHSLPDTLKYLTRVAANDSNTQLVANSQIAGTRAAAALLATELALLFSELPATEIRSRWLDTDQRAISEAQDPDRTRFVLALAAVLADPTQPTHEWQHEIAWDQIDCVVAAVRRLNRQRTTTTDPQRARQLTAVQIALIQAAEVSPRWQNHLELRALAAAALADQGERAAAIQLYQQLVELTPRNTAHQLALAQLYAAGANAEDQQQALHGWRQLASQASTESDLWYQAKLGIASALIRLDQRQRALDSIRQLQALHPDLGGPPWQAQFQALLSAGD